MAFLSYEQEASGASAKDVTDLTVPAKATGAHLQADTNDIRYTFDGTVPTSSTGMILATTHEPLEVLIEDLRAIQFIQGAGGAGNLNVHYFAGRDV